ncbi:cohesin domain-containing protein [Halorubrum sp. RMP-11]|uniref:Cohesin domain-containing protein n=1 Tax=Halorubrum miltondacostae TaxID=3076378 RepID=A0ABD5M0Z0_9EURY
MIAAIGIGAAGAAGDTHAVSLAIEAPEEAEPNETITLSVRANATEAVYGIDFAAAYDPDRVEVDDVSSGAYLGDGAGTIVGTAGANPDEQMISYAESRTVVESGITGEGVLATVTVTVDGNATGNLTFEFTEASAVDPAVEDLPVETSGTTVRLPENESTPSGSGDSADPGSTENGSSSNITGEDPENAPDEKSPPNSGNGNTDSTDDESSTDGSTSASDESDDSASSDDDWPETVGDEVRANLDSRERVGVIVHVNGDTDSVATALRDANATEVQQFASRSVVAAFADRTTVRAVAARENVTQIESDETAVTANPSPINIAESRLPSQASLGSNETVTVVLTNMGETAVNDDLTLRRNGLAVAERTVSVAPGEEVDLSFSVAFDTPENTTLSLTGNRLNEARLGVVSVDGDTAAQNTTDGVTTDDTPGFSVLSGLFALALFGRVLSRSR